MNEEPLDRYMRLQEQQEANNHPPPLYLAAVIYKDEVPRLDIFTNPHDAVDFVKSTIRTPYSDDPIAGERYNEQTFTFTCWSYNLEEFGYVVEKENPHA